MVADDVKIAEEHDPSGAVTGLELDDLGDIAEPFNPEDIDVITKPMTIDLVLARIREHAIDLQPDFQRRWGIWDQRRQSRLIESLLLRIPTPSLYAAEDQNENWEIVDGVQRLYTIAHFIEPGLVQENAPLMLVGLKSLLEFNGKTFLDLTTKLQRRLRETELVIHVIRKGTPPIVKFSIFDRINSGSVVLSAQELRHAITPGPVRDILARWAKFDEFKKATDNSVRTDRMADRELALRFLAFRLTPFSEYRVPDFDGFLLSAMSDLNRLPTKRIRELETEFRAAMVTGHAIYGADAFRKRYSPSHSRYPINKALFEALSVSLAALSDEQRARIVKSENATAAKLGLMRLCNDREFESAISQGTGDIAKVRRRFSSIASMIGGVLEAH